MPFADVERGDHFNAVTTTGIYCRGRCSGRPLEGNVLTYSNAAAAEAAGFRPCLVCRPDKGPNAPDWVGPSELVCRALRLIEDGALDRTTVDGLAWYLGVSGRHLRRLFDQHVGAPPHLVARSRRAHFARRLLDETDLSIAEIGFAAGFNSVRQMNRSMRDVFRFSPSQLRAKRRRRDLLSTDGGLRLRLPYRPPLDWPALRADLAERALPGIERVDATGYQRTIEVDGQPGMIELRWLPGEEHVEMTAQLPSLAGLIHLVARARRIFDLDANPRAIAEHLCRDPCLADLVEASPGRRVAGAWDPYELGVRTILEQYAGPAAIELAVRLVDAHGTPVDAAGNNDRGDRTRQWYLFPPADTLMKQDLHPLGIPPEAAETIRAFAERVAAGALRLEGSTQLDELLVQLTAVPGLCPVAAHVIAMRGCGEPDAFPPIGFGTAAEGWRPWRAYAALHLQEHAIVAGSGQP
jgi:AraC family transcriptional regulator of adaptative response / DNA-3-methyladenine glycosylase II